MMTAVPTFDMLRARLGDALRENVSLAPFTSARIGGPAEYLVTASSSDQLEAIVTTLWREGIGCLLLGGGSNVLVSDVGVRGVTILNRAKAVRFQAGSPPSVWAESGVVFSNLANRCALKGFSGLEWAGTVPGTVGGAVFGNAGAFGGDVAGSMHWAEVLTPSGRRKWPVESMGYGYRTSVLKSRSAQAVVLSAELSLRQATRAEVTRQMLEFAGRRKATQPPGASMGSMFKNPPGDKAGRLMEAAGLKGTRIGNAEISPLHANFFVNHGRARAEDVRALIELAKTTVRQKFSVDLELEIELVGEWH
jgi:UDP-N-acetylmuramate dehydrogenase